MNFRLTLPEGDTTLEIAKQESRKTVKTERIYAIDWLRVLAFGILMVYHTAEVFTTWNWWVKNEDTSPLLSYVMMFFHEWRMFLLFLISGAATHLALGKRSPVIFLKDRVTRILVPLIAGMLLVIPPQIYYIQEHQGMNVSLSEFYLELFEFKWFPSGNFHWLHLWYMAYLFVFIVIMLPIISYIKSEKGKQLIQNLGSAISKPAILLPLAILMEGPYYVSKILHWNSNLSSVLFYFPYYTFGALFLTHTEIRRTLIGYRRCTFLFASLTTTIFYLCFWIKDDGGATLIDPGLTATKLHAFEMLLTTLNHWFWVLCIIGYGMKYLVEGATFLNYANKAIAPFYILHQTVIVFFAYHTVDLPLDISVKFYLILGATFISIFLLYHYVLQRLRITQLLFGIKQ